MKRRCIYLIIILFISLPAVGEERVKTLYRMASLFHRRYPGRSIACTGRALTLAEELNDKKKLVFSQYKTII